MIAVCLETERPALFKDDETSANAYDPLWGSFLTDCWDDLTRASECTSDEAKDPDNSGFTHRIHWINTRLDDLCDMMLVLGKEEFGDTFTMSKPTMLLYKKYYHRYPGRNTCLCRYHQGFDHHFQAIRRWKNAARLALPAAKRASLVAMPDTPKELREFLMCPRQGKYYGWKCCQRKCSDCSAKLGTLFSQDEKSMILKIKYQAWTEVPYVCKDGRELKNCDWRPEEVDIEDYIKLLEIELEDFLPHHNRAKFLDNDWKEFFDNISRVDENIAASESFNVEHWWELPEEQWLTLPVEQHIAGIIDYANSYETEHKDEHMQQFWSHSSTTILGCAMKIPIQLLNDKFFEDRAKHSKSGCSAVDERMEALRVCAANHLPPEVVLMHFGMTSNPHHDTAGIQHFFKHNLYPDFFQKYTNSVGARFTIRSDGCAGQMKSARHFRWVANFHTEVEWNMQHLLVWTHSESAHHWQRSL